MRLATREQSRKIDRISQTKFGLTAELLMEAAGSGAAREIEQTYYPEVKSGHIGIVCGPGNNGGDGLVVARHLHSAGYRDICVYLAAPERDQSPLFKKQVDRVNRQGIQLVDIFKRPEKYEKIKSAKIIIDAVFGIGLARPLKDRYAKTVEVINSVRCPKVSLDVPSGLDVDTGMVLGVAVRSSTTITFGLAKPGFFIGDGPSHVGRLRVLPIGFPHEILRQIAHTRIGFSEKLARRYLPDRGDQSNKATHGHALMIAGRKGYWGAALLTATSAARMGAGYVTLASFEDASHLLRDIPEILVADAGDKQLLNSQKFTAVGVGPGLGVTSATARLIEDLKKNGFLNVVLDADAITTCVEYGLFPLPSSWVLTPHAGELSRILKWPAHQIESDRFAAAERAAQMTGCHVLLKGFRSVLAHDERALVIMAGNSSLAKAGTGDVLTGMITGLLAQKVPTVQATGTAAYIHGRMADEWVRAGLDKRALMPSDLRDQLPQLMARISHGAIL